MKEKSHEQILAEADIEEDELTMKELKNIADSLIDFLEIEYDCLTKHSELGRKVPVLDLAMWVEETKLSSPGTVSLSIHINCKDRENCHPLGVNNIEDTYVEGVGQDRLSKEERLEGALESATRLAQQVRFKFFSKPSAPQRVILASSAQPCRREGW